MEGVNYSNSEYLMVKAIIFMYTQNLDPHEGLQNVSPILGPTCLAQSFYIKEVI